MRLGGAARLSRALVVAAVLLLSFDGAALVLLGIWQARLLLVVMGGILLLAAIVTMVSWRMQQRRLAALHAEQLALRNELRDLDTYIERR